MRKIKLEFLDEFFFFNPFWTSIAKFSPNDKNKNCSKGSSKLSFTCFLEPCEEIFLGKSCILSSSFLDIDCKKFGLSSKKSRSAVSAELQTNSLQNLLKKNDFCRITLENEQTFIGFLSIIFHGVVKTAFHSFTGSFWGNYFFSPFSDDEWKVFGHLAKSFRQGCQNCILPAYWKIERRNGFFEQNLEYLHRFSTWS